MVALVAPPPIVAAALAPCAGAAEVQDIAEGDGDLTEDSFVVARDRTLQALRCLAERWKDEKHPRDGNGVEASVSGASARLLADPSKQLSQQSHAWALKVGLSYVPPHDAVRLCLAAPRSLSADGLCASTCGEPSPEMHPDLFVAPAPPCGYGLFTAGRLEKGEILGEYTGQVRDYKVWLSEIEGKKLARRGSAAVSPFIPEELYAAWTGNGPKGVGVVLDAFAAGNASRFINCSCRANCTFKSFGECGQNHHRVKVLALRTIEPWEQLSVDYGWYFDNATLIEVRARAVDAYNADREAIRQLSQADSPPPDSCSDAVRVLAGALDEASGRSGPPAICHFLRRFVDPQDFAVLMERVDVDPLPEATVVEDHSP